VPASDSVSLQRATPDMAPMLGNLLELYVHDLSEIFPVELGPDGRFGYEKLPLYWAEPVVRHAFVIKQGGDVAGLRSRHAGRPRAKIQKTSTWRSSSSFASIVALALVAKQPWRCGTACPDTGSCASRRRTGPGSRSGVRSFGRTRPVISLRASGRNVRSAGESSDLQAWPRARYRVVDRDGGAPRTLNSLFGGNGQNSRPSNVGHSIRRTLTSD